VGDDNNQHDDVMLPAKQFKIKYDIHSH